jgi:hypothetical protein
VKRLDREIVAEGAGASSWIGEIRAEGAAQLRIHLQDVTALDGSFVRLGSPAGAVIEVKLSSATGELWLPAVNGPIAIVEVPATTIPDCGSRVHTPP